MTTKPIIKLDNELLTSLSKIKKEIQLHESWSLISKYYHNEMETEFLLNLLEDEKEKSILDPSYGSGYLIDILVKNNFTKLFTSDIPSNNLLADIDNCLNYSNVRYFYSYFQNLREQSIKDKYDNIIVIGASLSYCQNWEKNKIIQLNKEEIYQSIEGLKSVLDENGSLFIGNAKIYNTAFSLRKSEDTIPFYDSNNEGIRVMRWNLKYDWIKLEKLWTCELFDNYQNTVEKFSLNSHLFTNEMLKAYCEEFFNDVEIIIAPEGCPEDIIKCTNPK